MTEHSSKCQMWQLSPHAGHNYRNTQAALVNIFLGNVSSTALYIIILNDYDDCVKGISFNIIILFSNYTHYAKYYNRGTYTNNICFKTCRYYLTQIHNSNNFKGY